ncbi:MAG: hypothetical protein U1B80_10685, partial [Anaerolineaceae bacterium]|nr:hypothetical protein [Anaerolineaceae bacterium]
MAKPKKLTAIYIATLYLFLGLGWILGSDQLLKWTLPAQIAFLDSQHLKALGIVLVSGLAIYILVLREQIKAQRYQQAAQQTQENYRRLVNSTQQSIRLEDAAGKITF